MRFASVVIEDCSARWFYLPFQRPVATLVCWMLALKFYFADNIFTLDVMEEPVIATDGFTYEKR